MSEIEKMYENAGVKKQYDYIVIQKNYNGKIAYTKRAVLEKVEQFKNKTLRIIEVCPFYPDFTAEKQLSLIKWLIREKYLIGRYIESYYELFTNSMISYNSKNECFEKSLAGLINNLWQDLTDQERTEITEILRG